MKLHDYVSKFLFILVFVVGLFFVFNFVSAATPQETFSSLGSWLKSVISSSFEFIFGPLPSGAAEEFGFIQSRIVLIAIWFMIMVTFYDIISNFSTFNKFASFAVSFASALIAANLGWIAQTISVITGIFVGVGTAAIYIGLFGAFVVFILVNLGITKYTGWILKRQLMIKVAKENALTEVGASNISSAVQNLRKVQKSFADEPSS